MIVSMSKATTVSPKKIVNAAKRRWLGVSISAADARTGSMTELTMAPIGPHRFTAPLFAAALNSWPSLLSERDARAARGGRSRARRVTRPTPEFADPDGSPRTCPRSAAPPPPPRRSCGVSRRHRAADRRPHRTHRHGAFARPPAGGNRTDRPGRRPPPAIRARAARNAPSPLYRHSGARGRRYRRKSPDPR